MLQNKCRSIAGQTIHIKLFDFGVNSESSFDPSTTCKVYAVFKERFDAIGSTSRVSSFHLKFLHTKISSIIKFHRYCLKHRSVSNRSSDYIAIFSLISGLGGHNFKSHHSVQNSSFHLNKDTNAGIVPLVT